MNIFRVNKINFDKISVEEYDKIKDFIINFTPSNINEMNAILNIFVNISKKEGRNQELIDNFNKIISYASELSPGNITSIVKFWVNNNEFEKAYELLRDQELSLSANYYFLEALIINDYDLDFTETFMKELLIKFIFPDDKIITLLTLVLTDKMKSYIFDYITNRIIVPSNNLWDIIKQKYECHKSTLNNNHCNFCKQKLEYYKLNDYNRENLLDRIERYKFNRQEHIKNKIVELQKEWDKFISFIKSNTFDIIIDGANVGMYENKGNFAFSNLQKICNDLSNYKILLIIHIRHKSNMKYLPSNVTVYFTPKHMYDDLFWVYASVYYNILAISNDQLSDVKSLIEDEEKLLVFSDNMLCRLDKNLNIIFPKLPIQKNGDYIHIPKSDTLEILCFST